MKINLNNSKDEAQVQIIPLIDVIFCILTFFLLAALQFSRQQAIRGINFDLATAKSGTTIPGTSIPGAPNQGQKEGDRLVLYLDALGQIIDISTPAQTQIPREQLRTYLENYVKRNPTKPLVLYAAKSVSYSDVIGTIDLLRQVGGDRVSLAVSASGADQPLPTSAPIPGAIPNQTIPNTVVPPNPIQPINPQINPQGNFNPNLPNQAAPVPGATVPSVQNVNPGTVPPQKQAPGTNNTAPQN